MSKPSQKVLDLEMQLKMSKACTEELRAEVSRLRASIDQAIDRLEEIDERGGGPAWMRAKDLLGSDLYLILSGLQKARSSTE